VFKIVGNTEGNEHAEVLHKLIKQFMPFSQEKLGFDKPVTIDLLSDPDNASNPLGKTAQYDPNMMKVTLFVDKRHVKDILRSLSHEMVHHTQNCQGKFDTGMDTGPGYAQDNEHLRNQEKQAYLLGNIHFRDWEDGIKMQQQENKQMRSKKLVNEIKRIEEDINLDEEYRLFEETLDEELQTLFEKEHEGCKCPKECPKHEKPKKVSKLKSEDAPVGGSLDEEYRLFEETLDEFLGAGMNPDETNENLDEQQDCPPGKTQTGTNSDGSPVCGNPDETSENWYKGGKDQLLFEELTRKWTKKR